MNITGIITAVGIIGGVGLLISIFLSVFGNIFRVEVDERETAIVNALPGNNCGGCGYAGCANLAEAIVKGKANVNACPVGGAAVAESISKIMGKDAGKNDRMVAYVKCLGTCDKTAKSYDYTGINDCLMASGVPGSGDKACDYGCLGYGSCKNVCKFDAIQIIDGIAVIDKEKCTSCGQCIKACPKHLIELVPYNDSVVVSCSSKDKGPIVMKVCKTGCIGCGICAKNCESAAITLADNVAHIDQDKCIQCGVCIEKCPKKVIRVNA